MAQPTAKQLDALNKAWSKGFLKYKLHTCQWPLYDQVWAAINNPRCLKYAVNCSRRFGKTTILLLIAMEYAIRNPGSNIRFFASFHNMISEIIHDVSFFLLEDVPHRHAPVYSKNKFFFPNGSIIHMAGLDKKQFNTSRGRATNLNILDEAGFIDNLEHVYKNVLMPATITTRGTTFFVSTPPESPAHDFNKIVQECEALGFYSKFTIHDNQMIDDETKALWVEEAGGVDSTTYKREYLAEFCVDENLSIIREWKDIFIQDVTPPEHYFYYHKYFAMDLGIKDFTAGIFGYYDFLKATLFIVDEFTINGPLLTTKLLHDMIQEKEKELWKDQKPYRRISDNNNLMLINDMITLHGMSVIATNKDELPAMVNELRLMVKQGRVIVHPKCNQTIGCLRYGIWDKNKKAFARSATYGHFDHLSSLIYLVRNLDKNTNPVPANVNTSISTHWYKDTPSPQMSQTAKALSTALFPNRLGKNLNNIHHKK